MPVPAPPISGHNGPFLSNLEIEAYRAEAKRRREARPWWSDDNIRYYAGPHLWESLRKVKTAAEILSPGADFVDASNNYRMAGEQLSRGNVGDAIGYAGWGLLSNLGFSEVSRPARPLTEIASDTATAILAEIAKKQYERETSNNSNVQTRRTSTPTQRLARAPWSRPVDRR